MPVKFRGSSEYTSTFKWSPSFRSASFKPTLQQSIRDAGKRSDEFYLLNEPGFTHKRAVTHRLPQAGDCLVWEASLEDKKAETMPVLSARGDSKNAAATKSIEEPIKKVVEPLCEVKKAPVEATQNKEKKISPKKSASKTVVLVKSPKKATSKKDAPAATKDKSTRAKSAPSKVNKSPRFKEEKSSPKPQAVPLRFCSKKMPSYAYPACRSVYQVNYQRPKNVHRTSPVISAYDMIHRASAQTTSPKTKLPFRFKTEYSMSYKVQEPLRKTLPEPSSPASPTMKSKVRDMHKSPAKKPKSTSMRRVKSEYDINYQERDFPVGEQTQLNEAAEKNKVNRDGANFDRTHAVQLHSPTNKCWDLSSVSTGLTSNKVSEPHGGEAMSVEADSLDGDEAEDKPSVVRKLTMSDAESETSAGTSVTTSERFNKGRVATPDLKSTSGLRTHHDLTTPVKVSQEEAVNDENAASDLNTGRSELTSVSQNVGSLTASSSATTLGSVTNRSTSTAANSSAEGRVPTPDLKRIGGAQRTHHDITTPSKGGTILTSPNSKKMSLSSKRPLSAVEPLRAMENTLVKNEKQPIEEKKNFTELPRRMKHIVRAPIRGALRDQEFQQFGKNTRPLSCLDRISIASRRSSVSVQNLLEKSLQRKDFWAKN